MNIRCSSLPTFMECASSLEECVHPISEHVEAADLGTAVHKALEELVNGGMPDLHNIALANHVNPEDLSDLFEFGAKAWLEIKEVFGEGTVLAEGEMWVDIGDGVIITGHPDLVLKDVVLDWKTGRMRYDARWQMEGYGRLCERKYAYTVWLRDRNTDEYELMDRDSFDRAIKEQVQKIGQVYSPGDHCTFCPRKMECDARNIQLKQTIALFKAKPTGGDITRDDMVRAYPFLMQVESACKKFRDILKNEVKENGPIDIGGGKELQIVDVPRDFIDPKLAWSTLAKYLTEDEIAKSVRVVKSDVESIIMDKTEKGQKTAKWNEVMGKLRDAGAVSKVHSQQMRAVKKGKE